MTVVASRYARALIDALAEASPAEGLEQLQSLSRLLESDPDIRKLLMSPVIPPDRRERFIGEIGQALGLDSRVRRLFGLAVERRRLGILEEVIAAYRKMLDERSGVLRARVTSAAPLTASEQQQIAAKLEQSTGKRVVVELDQDPSLISGLVVRIGSTVYDGSLRQHLAGFKQRLLAG